MESVTPPKKSRLTLYIIIGLVLGIALGYVLNKSYVAEENKELIAIEVSVNTINESLRNTTDSLVHVKLEQEKKTLTKSRSVIMAALDKKTEPFDLMADIFLRLIKMIVAPLVFTTLVVGVAKLGDITTVGRIGGKTLLWFVSASLMSLLLGMIMVNIFKPGIAMNLPLPEAGDVVIANSGLTIKTFLYHVFPTSVIDAMAKNEILQIVVFSLLFGIGTAAIGEKGKVIITFMDAAAHVILKVTGYVMALAPLAVFGAMTAIVAKQGLRILSTYSIFITEFYFTLLMLWVLLFLAGFVVLRKRTVELIKKIRQPILLAFSTSSSEAAFPMTMEKLEEFGCKDKIVSFVLPLGYSFNLDGSMMYMTFASLFIAQSYGIDLPIATQISMLLVLMLTSKGIAGVPRASLVVIAGTLATFNIPEAGLALLLGIDPLLDMGRSATNVVGNSVATAVVSKWENSLDNPAGASQPSTGSV